MNTSAAGEKIITAKLVRGKTYSIMDPETKLYVEFKRNVPVQVSETMAAALEELIEVTSTEDGDEIERERFLIDYDAEARVEDEPAPRRLRMKLVQVDDRPRRTVQDATTAKRPVAGLKPSLRRS